VKTSYFPSKKLCLSKNIAWEIPDNYLNKSELAMLDIIANNPERPIFFSNVIESKEMLGLKQFTRKEGFCNHLMLNADTAFNAEIQYKILTSQFAHKQIDVSLNINYDIKRFLRMVQLFEIYEQTLDGLIISEKKLEVEILVKQMQAVFPPEKFTYNERFEILEKAYNYLKINGKAADIHSEIQRNLRSEYLYISKQKPPFSYFLSARKSQIIKHIDTSD